MIFKLVNFLIFAGVLAYFLKKPIKDFWAERHSGIDSLIKSSRTTYEKLSNEESSWMQKIKNIDKEISLLLEELKKEGRIEAKKIIEDAKKYALRLSSDCNRAIQYETDLSLKEIRKKVVDLAILEAAKRIATESTPAEQLKITESAAGNIEGAL